MPALTTFRRLQVGREATPGTLVPATRQIIGDGALNETAQKYFSPYPMGVRVDGGGAGTTLQRGTEFSVDTELTAEEILWPLLTGIEGGVTPTPGATGDEAAQTWVFAPPPTAGSADIIDTMTMEYLQSDGVTNFLVNRAGNCFTSGFTLNWAASQIATMNWTGMGRAREASPVPTAAIVPYPSRQPLASNFTTVSLDPTWAGLGTTPIVGTVEGGQVAVTTGLAAKYKMDGRETLDFSHVFPGLVTGTVQLTMELESQAAAELQHWRDNDLRYLRILQVGSVIDDTATSIRRSIRIDACIRLTDTPTFSDSDGEQVMQLNGALTFDTDPDQFLEITVINEITEASL